MPASFAALGSTRVSTTTTRMPAWLALAMAGAISLDPEGVTSRTFTPVWIRFSMICICLSTSTSRSAACTVRFTPRRFAASCAPFSMSMKKGLLRVLSTMATRGAPVEACDEGVPSRAPQAAGTTAIANTHTARLFMVASFRRRLEHRVHEHGGDDHHPDHDLLEERRRAQQVQPVAQHAHDERADQRPVKRAH